MADIVFLKNVTENPCHMCMPIGGILPLKGIEGAMVIIHGSQGCSTYMRRAIAEHYNEPIDVASSSLNEKGTIYGGESNLRKALDNVRKVYKPRLIGVLTTCLAETIGEDIDRITAAYRQENDLTDPVIVTVPTPGYGGGQLAGHFLTLRRVVEQLTVPGPRHGRLNLITANISPADTRELKRLLALLKVEYTLLPDLSETLDRPYDPHYCKLPPGGTRLADIRAMGGAAATIELGATIADDLSPGQYLADVYDVPLYRLPLPIGLSNCDTFLRTIRDITGQTLPESLAAERGRLMDAMVDSHKYNAAGRSVIFGDPELVYAVTGLCLENGIQPVVAAAGSGETALTRLVAENDLWEPVTILAATDFTEIRDQSAARAANIAIGPSDGRYLTEREGIPLVRLGFPILDRVGGQRLLSVGYSGTVRLLDRITNTLLDAKHREYRGKMYDLYYSGSEREQTGEVK